MVRLVVVAVLLAQVDPHQVRLAPTSEPKPGQLEKCASVLLKRCEAYGYQGVWVKDSEKGMVFVSPNKVSKDMASVVAFLASSVGRSVEVRLKYERSQAEQEQFPEPQENKAISPKGSTWFKTMPAMPGVAGGGGWQLLRDDVIAKGSLRIKPVDDRKTEYYVDLPPSASKHKPKDDSILHGVFLVVDGLSSPLPGKIEFNGKIRLIVDSSFRAIDPILQYPMDLAFKRE